MEPVFFFDEADPEMGTAKEAARKTFRFFMRELSWEYRRIVPGLELSAVKVAFRDLAQGKDEPPPEEMWVGEVEFDGRLVRGVLLNAPNRLTSVSEGDPVAVPLGHLSDWMYVMEGKAYGGHTVQVLRARMPAKGRQAHDQAWGFDFGLASKVRLVPAFPPSKGKSVPRSATPALDFGPGADGVVPEHPMALNMVPMIEAEVRKNPSVLSAKDNRGLTVLHQMVLAGTKAGVAVLLTLGADARERTGGGLSCLDLAETLGWPDVVEALRAKGA